MWYGHHGFPFFPLFFLVPFVVFVIFRIVAFRRYGRYGYGYCGGWDRGRFDAEAILKRRLASGEIQEDEYNRILETLKK